MELDDLFGDVDLESIERKVDFERMLATLSERDRRVVLLYAQGYTQVEIGVEVGCSDRQIRRILKNVRFDLKNWMLTIGTEIHD